MNKNLKEFLRRGLIFAGFGPVVAGIVFIILDFALGGFSLGGSEVLLAIASTYILAFVHAGSSVFHQIEEWSISKALLCQLSLLYVSYTLCYIINSWIPFEPMVILIYTAIFVVAYLLIWLIVYLSVRGASRRYNAQLKR